jgi:GntR family transcriptional repressor for pyruvate dehydrogenase complex
MRTEPADMTGLRELINDMRTAEEIDEYHALDTAFHIELARVSGSVLLPVLMEALRATVTRAMLEGLVALDDWRSARDDLVAQHAHIVDLIEAGNALAATSAMREHVLGFYRDALAAGDRHDDRTGEQ